MIFIHLSQSSHVNPQNTVPLITWYQDAAFRFVIYRTNERKNSGWAAAELTSPRQARAALGAAAGLGLRAQYHHWPTRNRGTKGQLIRLRPTPGVDQPPVVQRRTWEALANSGAFPLVK